MRLASVETTRVGTCDGRLLPLFDWPRSVEATRVLVGFYIAALRGVVIEYLFGDSSILWAPDTTM